MAQAQTACLYDIIDLTAGDDEDKQLGRLSSAFTKAEAAASRLNSQLRSLSPLSNGNPFAKSILFGENNFSNKPKVEQASNDFNKEPRTGHASDRGLEDIRGNGGQAVASEIERPPTHSRQSAVEQRESLPHGEGSSNTGLAAVLPLDRNVATESSGARSPQSAVHYAAQVDSKPNDIIENVAKLSQQYSIGHKRKRSSQSPDIQRRPAYVQPRVDSANTSDLTSSADSKRRSLSRAQCPLPSEVSPVACDKTIDQGSERGYVVSRASRDESIPGAPEPLQKDKAVEANDCSGKLEPSLCQASTGAVEFAITNRTWHQPLAQASPSTAALSQAFDDIIFPAIRKQKKRHKGRLPDSELLLIGREVVADTVDQKLRSYSPAQLSQLTRDQTKDLKVFIKRTYKHKVVRHPATLAQDLSSKPKGRDLRQSKSGGFVSTTPANDFQDGILPASRSSDTVNASGNSQRQFPVSQGRISDLSEHIRNLEKIHSLDLDVAEDPSPICTPVSPSHQTTNPISCSSSWPDTIIGLDKFDDSSSEAPKSLVVSLRISGKPSSQNLHDAIKEDSFPPDFDRGRFPAQRRRRGNKHYTPGRPSEAAMGYHSRTKEPDYQLANPNLKLKEDTSQESLGFSKTLQAADDKIDRMLIARIATIPKVKALAEAIASGKPSLAQETAWTEFADELSRSKDSGTLSEFEARILGQEGREDSPEYNVGSVTSQTTRTQVPERRNLSTALNPHLEQLTAQLITSKDELLPKSQSNHHNISLAEQQALLRQPTLLKHVGRPTKRCKSPFRVAEESSFTRLESKVVDPVWQPQQGTSALLRNRELGSDPRGRNVNINRELQLRTLEKINPWRSWKGASGDVVAVAWSSDSSTFAAGAAAHTNPEDVQYNRPCNLLYGKLISNTVAELPDHRVDRPKPETLVNTYNSQQAVYDACDPMVYETVSSIAFSPMSDQMYTASYDRTVKIWDTQASQATCLGTLHHNGKVTSIDASPSIPGLFATATELIEQSIRIYYTDNIENVNPAYIPFSSSRALAKQEWKISPECIHWGSTSYTSHLLLAGFRQRWTDEAGVPQQGHLCLWDINTLDPIKVAPSSQSVLAAAWHPVLPFFATGGAPGSYVTEKDLTKSVVRTWDLRNPLHYTMEYECSALDMQDITFHPTDSHIVTAGCTDGTSFVWDFRRPGLPLHRLKHGRPLADWDHNRGQREEVDCGVMMSLWGPGGSLFYTGSSDGMIKAWDIRRHPQDVLQRNVAQFSAGIQSGAFSPDGTNLLVGDSDGGVHLLSSAPCGPQPNIDGSSDVSPELPMTLVRAPNGSGLALNADESNPGTEGIQEAKRLTDSTQMKYDSELGVTQGPIYHGPFAMHHRKEALPAVTQGPGQTVKPDNKHFFLRTSEENVEVECQRRSFIAARKQRIKELYVSPKATLRETALKISDLSTERLADRCSPYSSGSDVSARSSSSKSSKSSRRSWSAAFPRLHPKPLIKNALGIGGYPFETDRRPSKSPSDLSENNIIPESKMVEENHWWPDLGRDEITRARAGRGHENFLD